MGQEILCVICRKPLQTSHQKKYCSKICANKAKKHYSYESYYKDYYQKHKLAYRTALKKYQEGHPKEVELYAKLKQQKIKYAIHILKKHGYNPKQLFHNVFTKDWYKWCEAIEKLAPKFILNIFCKYGFAMVMTRFKIKLGIRDIERLISK